MARYQKCFELDTQDVAIIEEALRQQIARLSARGNPRQQDISERIEIRTLNHLLGKIHNQKIFFAQVSASGVPAG